MPYEKELFECEIADELICNICLCILEDPIALPCEHLYCRPHITTYLQGISFGSCPLCKSPAKVTDIKRAPRCVVNMVDKLVVKCPFYKHGCTTKINLKDLDDHELNCPHGPCYLKNRECQSPGELTVKMQITVKLNDGAKTLIIDCSPNDTVIQLKSRIYDKSGIDATDLILIFGTVALKDSNKTLSSYNVHQNCLLYATRRFDGGQLTASFH